MNPIKDDATSLIKANIKDIRTVYLDLDRNGDPQDYARRIVAKAQAELDAQNPQSNFLPDSSAESEREL
jgi:hypothetical protein